MSKVEELRARVVQCFATSGGPGVLDEYIQAVREESEARVWRLIEKVVGAALNHGITAPWRWWVDAHGVADNPRDAVLLAAKDLWIEVEE